jgi:hypothetical protein
MTALCVPSQREADPILLESHRRGWKSSKFLTQPLLIGVRVAGCVSEVKTFLLGLSGGFLLRPRGILRGIQFLT